MNSSIQFYLYNGKSQQQPPRGALYCKLDTTIIHTEENSLGVNKVL